MDSHSQDVLNSVVLQQSDEALKSLSIHSSNLELVARGIVCTHAPQGQEQCFHMAEILLEQVRVYALLRLLLKFLRIC